VDDRKPIDHGGAFAGVPLCSFERCPSYDGKRCRETGNEPDRICMPEVRAQRAEFVHLRSIMRVDRRRLAGGVEPMVGQRVVKVRAVADAWRMPHAYDDKVHVITSLLGGTTHLVELGPEQVGVAMLQLAPPETEVTCTTCRGWREQMAKMRADAEVYRREQIGEVHDLRAQLAKVRADLDTMLAAHDELLLDRDNLEWFRQRADAIVLSSDRHDRRVAALRDLIAERKRRESPFPEVPR
jgi:hypothetical protein